MIYCQVERSRDLLREYTFKSFPTLLEVTMLIFVDISSTSAKILYQTHFMLVKLKRQHVFNYYSRKFKMFPTFTF